MDKEQTYSKPSTASYIKFIIPSLIGIFLFMIPISYAGEVTIPVALLADWIQGVLEGTLPTLMTVIITLTVILTLIATIAKPSYIMDRPFLKSLLHVKPVWVIARILGMIFAIMTLYKF